MSRNVNDCITVDSSPEKVGSSSKILRTPSNSAAISDSGNDCITLDSEEDSMSSNSTAISSSFINTSFDSRKKTAVSSQQTTVTPSSSTQTVPRTAPHSENHDICIVLDDSPVRRVSNESSSDCFILGEKSSPNKSAEQISNKETVSAPSCSTTASNSKTNQDKVDFFNLESSDTDEEQLSVETKVNDLLCSAAILDDIESGPSKCTTPISTSIEKVAFGQRQATPLFAASTPIKASVVEGRHPAQRYTESPVISTSSVIQGPIPQSSPVSELKGSALNVASASVSKSVIGQQPTELLVLDSRNSSFSETTLPKKRFKRDFQINDLVAVEPDDENKCEPFPLMYREDNGIPINSGKLLSRIPKEKSQIHAAHTSAITALSWCIPRYSHLLLTASADSSLKIWDICHKKHVQYFKHSLALKAASWTLDGETVITGGYGCQAHVYDVLSGKHFASYSVYMPISCIAMHPTIEDVFLCGLENSILAFDLRVDKLLPIRTYITECNEVLDIAFLNDKEFVSSNSIVSRDSADRTIMVWDFHSGAILSNQIYLERYTCPSIKVHPSDTSFIAQSNGNYIASFSTNRPYKVRNKIYDKHKVAGYKIECDISPDGQFLASGDADGDLYFYDYFKTDLIHKFPIKSNVPTNRVKWHPVLSSTLAVTSWDGQLSILK